MSEIQDELRRWLGWEEVGPEIRWKWNTDFPADLERLLRRVAGCAAVDHMGVRLSDFPEPEGCPYCNCSILTALRDERSENDGD